MFFLGDHERFQLHLLDHARRQIEERDGGVVAFRAGAEAIIMKRLDVPFRKEGPLMFGVRAVQG